MHLSLQVAAAAIVLLPVAWCIRAAWRMKVRRSSTQRREQIIAGKSPQVATNDSVETLAATFQSESLINVANFLSEADLATLREEALQNQERLVRSYVPGHKQGGTVSYELLHHHAPHCLALYHSPALHRWISSIVGAKIFPTADHDQSACSILYYTQPGDFINWHRDPNFYRGRQFTLLIVLVDRSNSGGPSSSRLMRKLDGREQAVPLAENGLVLFEGPRVVHKVSPTTQGDTRIALSMTFNTDPRIRLISELARRVKDTAFFGWRVLWD